MVHTFYVHIFTMDIAYLLTANKLLLIGWNVQHSTSGPRVDPYTRIHLVLDTSHRRTVPSSELDSMLSLDSDQAKSRIEDDVIYNVVDVSKLTERFLLTCDDCIKDTVKYQL